MSAAPQGAARAIRTPEARFEGLPGFPYTPRYVEVARPGGGRLRMHYLDEGPRAVIPEMRARGRGQIVLISSVVTDQRGAGYAPYAMSKAALEALASVLAKEERAHGIRVNVVAPGLVATEMGKRYVRSLSGQDEFEPIAGALPFGRVCEPEEVAAAVRFLVSDRASYVTGEKLRVHGGG